jgi:hypothetical protein
MGVIRQYVLYHRYGEAGDVLDIDHYNKKINAFISCPED